MVLFDALFDMFFDHAAVINDDETALKKEVKIVKRKYGKWFKVKGFTHYKDLFLALRVAQAKRNPYTVAFIRENEKSALDMILKNSDPNIKTYKYFDTQDLNSILPKSR